MSPYFYFPTSQIDIKLISLECRINYTNNMSTYSIKLWSINFMAESFTIYFFYSKNYSIFNPYRYIYFSFKFILYSF